eukprot:TRINITY_DN59981_c0_g1_i1.p1 TRINITY_DN59981_c0_g1~~TRINITY_DN59981_c0_g1_i1.p1  ORF type:complete len:631 (+),score=174.33 TRINITY_DN59981_c0_g1_i1:70-1893(+)
MRPGRLARGALQRLPGAGAPGSQSRRAAGEALRAPAAALAQPPGELASERLAAEAELAERRAAEHPAVDYLALMEELHGPKEEWRAAPDVLFLRRAVAVLCRKIDDLRERIAAAHARNRVARGEARRLLSRLPLLKREAWQSPDWQRAALVGELRRLGYLDSEGSLRLPEMLPALPGSAAPQPLALAAPAPPQPAGEGGGAALAAGGDSAAALAPWAPSAPLLVDPLGVDLYAPEYCAPAGEVALKGKARVNMLTRKTYSKLPNARRLGDMVSAQHGYHAALDEGPETEWWGQFPRGSVRFTRNAAGKVTRVAAFQSSEHYYEDPSPRDFADVEPGARYADAAKADAGGHAAAADPAGGRGGAGQAAAEGAAGAGWEGEGVDEDELDEGAAERARDPVMQRLHWEKRRRRQQQETLWARLDEPALKPAEAIGAVVARELAAAEGQPYAARIDRVERALLALDDVGAEAATADPQPPRGPDAADTHFATAGQLSRQRGLALHAERKRLQALIKAPIVTGAKAVPLLPTHPGQLPFQHKVADAEGVWYSVSSRSTRPGRPLKAHEPWPRGGAVRVPLQVHRAARADRGYAALQAREEIRRITTQLPRPG